MIENKYLLVKYNNLNNNSDNNIENNECIICLENLLENDTITIINNKCKCFNNLNIHYKCLNNWLNLYKNCIICTINIDKKDIENKSEFEITYLKRINLLNYNIEKINHNFRINNLNDQKQIAKITILIIVLIFALILSNVII